MMRINKHIISDSQWNYVKAKVNWLAHLHPFLTHDSVYVHLSGCILDKEMETNMLHGNKHHRQSIEQLCLSATGKSLPGKDTVRKQIHAPDTTGME
jgi:hypothetical protein